MENGKTLKCIDNIAERFRVQTLAMGKPFTLNFLSQLRIKDNPDPWSIFLYPDKVV